MKDIRLISLCNVPYKIHAKVLATRLSRVVDKFVFEKKFAFMSVRFILDNALIASEIIQHMKNKSKGLQGEAALKIDINEAFDRVSWNHLKAVMIDLGFSSQWVQWIYLCVSSTTYSILVNGDSVGPIFPGNGLRQGDPLTPLLFILCAEAYPCRSKMLSAKVVYMVFIFVWVIL